MPDTTTTPWLCPRDETCPAGHRQHDTATSYHSYGCRSGAAREAARLYRKRMREGRAQSGFVVNTVGLRRRIEAACYMGWPVRRIAAEVDTAPGALFAILHGRWETAQRRNWERLVPILERLANTPGPHNRTRLLARKRGYCSLLAWDDIDDPNERPAVPTLEEQIADFAARGFSQTEVARRLGYSVSFVWRRWPRDHASEVDVSLYDAVLDPSHPLRLVDCTEPEQDHVVERLYRDVVARGYDRPTQEIAGRLGTDVFTVERVRGRIRTRDWRAS